MRARSENSFIQSGAQDMSSDKKTKPTVRHTSFKLKITVWITVLITVVSSLGVAGILITGSQITNSRLQHGLIGIVERNVDEIEYKNGILEVESDFAFFVDEVYCNVYDENGRYIDGESPTSLINGSELRDGEVGSFEADGSKYYYYDTRLDFKKFEYEIDAFSGRILKYEADTVMSGLSGMTHTQTRFENGISTDEAVDIAVKHAGLSRDELDSLSVELTGDSDKTTFKVEFVCENSDYPSVWVRGVVNADAAKSAFEAINKTVMYMFPLFVVIAALGAYFISRKTMEPVENLSRSAREVTDGNDLSKRIELKNGTKELHYLTDTFNEMLARLQSSFEIEKRFTSDASHELRTPLAVIKAECEYALSDNADDAERLEALKSIDEQTDKMTRLVSSLLTLSRTEQGDKRYKLAETDISELVNKSIAEFVPSKNITVTGEVEEGIVISAHAQLFTLMLENLLSNAVKYGKESGNVKVTLSRRNAKAVLTVSDDGIGIKAEDLEKIWGRFYRADESRSKGEGFGLGLSIVRQIVELHGGEVDVKSVFGQGSEFIVTL